MTIVKQISLFDIQELFEMESSHQFDAIISTFDVQPLHYAMIHSAKRYLFKVKCETDIRKYTYPPRGSEL